MKGPGWNYKDGAGVERTGIMLRFSDRGGTDVTYFMRSTDGFLTLLSGSRLREAKPLNRVVEVPDNDTTVRRTQR